MDAATGGLRAQLSQYVMKRGYPKIRHLIFIASIMGQVLPQTSAQVIRPRCFFKQTRQTPYELALTSAARPCIVRRIQVFHRPVLLIHGIAFCAI